MTTLLAVVPLLAVVIALVRGRASLLRAGLLGLALTAPAVVYARPAGRGAIAHLLGEAALGAWLAWPAIAVIFAGLAFHTAVRLSRPALLDAAGRGREFSSRRLFAACFLLGPFAECATGFGVGSVFALAVILRMGVAPVPAATFALLSQVLVPWGALGLGTALAASLVRLPAGDLGRATAALYAPLVLGHLVLFWALCARHGVPLSARQRAEDALWSCALAAGLYAAHRALPVETTGLVVTGALLVLRHLRDEAPSASELGHALRGAAPFLALTLCLVVTRVVAPLSDALQHHLVLRPHPAARGFPVLFHVSAWLLLVAAAQLAFTGRARAIPRALASTWRSARVPATVTLVFVVMARWMSAAGFATEASRRLGAHIGGAALLAAPLLGAAMGFLTGSNVASNSMTLPPWLTLAEGVGASPLWVASVQNAAGSAMTLFSPVRVGMVSAAAGIAHEERAIYRAIAPLAPVILGVLVVVMALVVRG